MSGVRNKCGKCIEGPKIDDSHVLLDLESYLDLDLDLVNFQAFARIRIFLGISKVWHFVMIYNMIGGGPSIDALQEFFHLVLFHFLIFDF